MQTKLFLYVGLLLIWLLISSPSFAQSFTQKRSCPQLLRLRPKLFTPVNRWIEVKDGKFLLCLPGVRLEIFP